MFWTTVVTSIIAMLIAVPLGVGGRAVHHPVRAALAGAAGRARWSTCSPRCPRSSTASGALIHRGQYFTPVQRRPASVARLDPVLRDDAGRQRQSTIVFTGRRAGDHGPADRHGDLAARSSHQTPTAHKEGALALGATQWEMIRTAVLPFGRPGVISASMLGLGRALGETVAVRSSCSPAERRRPWTWSVFNGGETFASKIANNASEFDTPAEDRRLHRRRPGAVRADLRRQRHRPHRHRAQEGLHRMSTVAARQHRTTRTAGTAGDDGSGAGVQVGRRGPPRTSLARIVHVGRVLPRRSSRWSGSSAAVIRKGGQLLLESQLVDQLAGAASPPAASAAAPRTPSRAR